MSGRCQQPAIVVLAMDLDQHRPDLAQQRGGGGLIVDERAASAIGLDQSPDDQRLAGIDLQPILGEQLRDGWGGIERRGDDRLCRPPTHQRAFAAPPQSEPQRIEQDRFARAGLPGQHAEAGAELQLQRLDQHDVTNG